MQFPFSMSRFGVEKADDCERRVLARVLSQVYGFEACEAGTCAWMSSRKAAKRRGCESVHKLRIVTWRKKRAVRKSCSSEPRTKKRANHFAPFMFFSTRFLFIITWWPQPAHSKRKSAPTRSTFHLLESGFPQGCAFFSSMMSPTCMFILISYAICRYDAGLCISPVRISLRYSEFLRKDSEDPKWMRHGLRCQLSMRCTCSYRS